MPKETGHNCGAHDCAEVDAGMETMREFFVMKLAVDADGLIHGTHHYHGNNLEVEPITPMPVARLCSTVADMVRNLMPQVLEAAHFASELAEEIEEIIDSRAKENDDSNKGSDSESPDTTATSGQLKQHGTVIH